MGGAGRLLGWRSTAYKRVRHGRPDTIDELLEDDRNPIAKRALEADIFQVIPQFAFALATGKERWLE